MKTLIILAILFIGISGQCFEKTQKRLPTLVVAIYDFPPHVMIGSKNTTPQGAAIDFLEKALNLGEFYKIQWSVSPFSRFLIDMQSQKADVGVLLAKTSEREKLMRYSEHAIFTTDAGIILNKDFKFTDIKSLDGLILGHTQGSVVPDYFKTSKVKFDQLSGEDVVQRNLQRLKLKRIDAVYIPTYSNGEYFLKQLGMEDQFKISKIPNTTLDLYLVFRKDISEETYTHLNGLITKKRAQYGPFLEKYFLKPSAAHQGDKAQVSKSSRFSPVVF